MQHDPLMTPILGARTATARALLLLVCAGLLGAWPGAGAAAVCDCASAADDPGVVYRGAETPTLDEVVTMLAPVLWFSPDEPLLLEGHGPIPAAHPCDAPAVGPIVYYQVHDIVLRGEALVNEPPESDPEFFDKVSLMSLEYFFYYPRDVGMGGHTHDIEGATFDVRLEREGGCHTVRLLLVKAAAHGQPWYSNRLKPAPGTHFPITLLVEEGKHASCTDRNSDGRFTPGYDVNQFVNDGWGVRDVFGAGFLFTGNYAAYMTKPREPGTRLLPPVDAPPPCAPAKLSALRDPAHSLGRYALRPGSGLGLCDAMGTGRDSAFLAVMMRVNGLGRTETVMQVDNALELKFSKTLAGAPALARHVALRYDEGDLGITHSLFGIDAGEGWLVGRLHYMGGVSTELMFVRSASRWTDGYFLGGWEWKQSKFEKVDGVEVETRPYRTRSVWETGVRFRVGLPEGPIRLMFLNQRFAGIRAGVRFNGVERLRDARFSLEFGSGVW